MTITPTAVTGNFNTSTYNFIKLLEGDPNTSYLDSEKVPSIGVGFALLVKSGATFSVRSDLATAFAGIHTFSGTETSLLSSMASYLSAANPAQAETIFNGRSAGVLDFTLSSTAMRSLYDYALDSVLSVVRGSGSGTIFQNFESTHAGTKELQAIYSLVYNSPTLFGTGLADAIDDGDRARAWYEILYHHANYNDAGLMNRRETEAGLFGLTNAGASAADVALELNTLFNGTDHGSNDIYATIKARDTLKPFETQIEPQLTLVRDFYTHGESIDYIQVADGNWIAGGTINSKDSDDHSGDHLTKNLMVGSASADTISGNAGDDFLYGMGGADTLNGGDDNDWLSGGAGADTLNGGSGSDTADYSHAAAGVTVSIGSNTASDDGDGSSDTLSSIENVMGSDFSDDLTGSVDVNTFYGSIGDDVYDGVLTTAGFLDYDIVDYSHLSKKIEVTNTGAGSFTVDKGASSELGQDDLTRIGIIVGTRYDDTFNSAESLLYNPSLASVTTYDGGDGNDTYNFDLAEVATETFVRVYESGDHGLDVINVSNFDSGTMVALLSFNDSNPDDPVTLSFWDTLFVDELLSISVLGNDTVEGHGAEFFKINGTAYSISAVTQYFELTSTTSLDFEDFGTVYNPIFFTPGSGGIGAGGGASTTVNGGGSITGVSYSPTITSGDWVPYPYGTQSYHAPVVTSFFASSGSMAITTESYVKEINFSAGITINDIRFTLSNISSPGDQYLDIHIDSLDQTFTIPYFEAGKTIHGVGLYNTTLHTWIQGGSGDFSGGNGNMSGSFGGTGTPSYSSGTYDITYFLQTISATGGSINMQGDLTFTGTDDGDTLTGLVARADTILGLDGNDSLYSYGEDDTLIGGAGADSMNGGTGDDVYEISIGESASTGDIVGEQAGEGTDTILMHGINPEDLRFWTDQYGYFYLSQSSGDLVTGYGAYTSGVGLELHVEQIEFDDSTVWDLTAGLSLIDTDDAHTIYGSGYADIIDGRDGADSIYGWAGADILIGGIAADWLYGGTGDDTYVFSVGDSPSAGDIISEQASEGIDTVLFHGIDPEDLRLWVDSSGYIYLSQASGDLITGYGSYTSGVGVELNIDKIEFDDTTIWDLTAGWSMTDTDDAHTIYGSGYADTIDGRDGADSIYGWAGADILIGGIAADWLYGGTGDDTYVFSVGDSPSAGDIISEQASEGIDTVLFHGIDPEDLRLWIDSSGYIYLSQASGDLVTGYGVYTTGVGVKLNVDKIEFDDTTIWDLTTGLLLTDTDDAHTIYGSGEGDTIDGRDGADSIYGWAGADTLIGGIAADWLYGGTGNDTYVFSVGDSPSAGDIISEQASEGIDTVLFHGIDPEDLRFWVDSSGYFYLSQASGDLITGYGTYTSGVGVELNVDKIEFDDTTIWDLTTGLPLTDTDDAHTIYGSSKGDAIDGRGGADSIYGWNGADMLLGGAGADYIYGGDGNDILEGGADDDTMDGEGGSDTASYLNAGSAVTVTLATVGTGQNTGGAGTDTLSGMENLIGSAYNDTLTGDGNANVIEGGAGNDAINGAGGTDTVSYAGAGSAVTVNLATGTAQNTVGAGTDTLTSMENLLASAYNDTITGSSGNNVIDGGAGNDTLDGSGGTDTVSYASASAGVTASLALGSAQNTIGAGTDTLSNFENLTGSAFGDVLTGSTGNNTIAGGDGDDTVEGGAGNDTMTGGNGTDTVSFANAGSATTFNLATTSSQNTVSSGSDTVSGFENILGSAFNDTLTGNGSANVIEGGAGNDTIDGAGGTDTLTYANAGSAVTVNLATGTAQNTGGAGTDTISNFENLTGSAYNDTLTGTSGNNTIEGGAGNDTLDGSGGTDTLTYVNAGSAVTVDLSNGSAQNTGGAGTDTLTSFENLTGSAYNDTLTGTTGNNTVLGGDGNDTIYGNSGTDTLKGGNGNDTLSGQAGTDTLYGEGGSDIFAFEVASAFSNQDTIADFSISDLDVLDISALLVGWNPTQSAIDEFVTFGTSGSDMTLSVDRDGAGATYSAQAIATLSNISGLDADDLLAHGQLLAA